MSPDEQALLERPISDLNLSVRARKCMIRLGHQHDRRIGSPHGRRSAGVQEFRRDEPERSPREADGKEPEAPRRLMVNASLQTQGRPAMSCAMARSSSAIPGLSADAFLRSVRESRLD